MIIAIIMSLLIIIYISNHLSIDSLKQNKLLIKFTDQFVTKLIEIKNNNRIIKFRITVDYRICSVSIYWQSSVWQPKICLIEIFISNTPDLTLITLLMWSQTSQEINTGDHEVRVMLRRVVQ